MTTSATQSGVQGQEQGAAATTTTDTPSDDKREPTPRELMMDQIDAHNTQRLNDEMVAGGQPPIVAAPAAEVAAATPAADDQVAAQAGEPTVLSDNFDKVMVKTKINGVEETVPLSTVLLKYQKGNAADLRLDEASRLLREAKEQADALKAAGQTPPVRSDAPNAGADTADQPSEAVQAAKRKFLKAMFDGDEEQALAALDEITPGRRQPIQQIDTNKLAQDLKQQLVVDSALEKFTKDNPDIAGDTYLDQMTADFIKQEINEGKTFIEALEPAVKKTRDWLASKGVKAPADPPPTMDRTTKLDRKAGIDVIPALNTKATTTEEPEQSASDVIAEMRKARGMEV